MYLHGHILINDDVHLLLHLTKLCPDDIIKSCYMLVTKDNQLTRARINRFKLEKWNIMHYFIQDWYIKHLHISHAKVWNSDTQILNVLTNGKVGLFFHIFTPILHFEPKNCSSQAPKVLACHSNGWNNLFYIQTNVIIPISTVETAYTWNLQLASLCPLIVTVKTVQWQQ